MANKCVIVFDQNEYGTYFTGQQLTGKVIITLNKPKTFKGIKLQVNGYAQCQWREKHGRKKPIYNKKFKKKHSFFGHEDYIASSTFLVGSEAGENFAIDAGTHTYIFSSSIPANCPSSYEGTYGHIRYTVKVTFIKAGASNRTYTKGFTVLQFLDLNKESTLLKSPASNESFENLCLLYSKAVHVRTDITQTGFVPGQMILVSCRVNNDTKANVKNLLISLNLRATYISDTPCMRSVSEKLCLVKKYCGPVARHSARNFAEIIRVPATPPTCDYLSKAVRISYEICVKALMGNFMSNPKTVIPIMIGNVPLACPAVGIDLPQIDDAPTTSTNAAQRDSDDDQNFLAGETEVDYELPPPTYEEAMYMTTNIADDDANTVNENSQFTPRYPVYDVDNIVIHNTVAQSPPPNPPQKRKKDRKIKARAVQDSKVNTESPIEI